MEVAWIALLSAVLVAVISTGGVIAVKVLDGRASRRTERATAAINQKVGGKADKAMGVAADAKGQTDANAVRLLALEAETVALRAKQTENDQRADRLYADRALFREQYDKLDAKYYELQGENKHLADRITAQDQTMRDMQIHSEHQDVVIKALTDQNATQHKRIEALETWQVQADAHMDELEALLPAEAKASLKTQRPKGRGRLSTIGLNGGSRQ